MLTKKAKDFVLKYQQGGAAQGNITPSASMYEQPNQVQPKQDFLHKLGEEGIPLISNLIQSGVGAFDFINSFKDKKKQKVYETQYKEEVEQKRNDMRANSFYKTPYSYQQGGLLDQAQQQAQQQTDEFANFQQYYDTTNQYQQENFNQLKSDFERKNLQKTNNWKEERSTGLKNYFAGNIGVATSAAKLFLQKGGFVSKERMKRLLAPHYYSNYPEYKQQGGIQQESTLMNIPDYSQIVSNTQQFNQKHEFDLKNDTVYQDNLASVDMQRMRMAQENLESFKAFQKMNAGANPEKLGLPIRKQRFYEKQDGGVQDYNSKLDLYSPDFDPNQFNGIEQEIDKADIEDKEHNTLMDWVFEDSNDSEPQDNEVNDSYFGGSDNEDKSIQVGLRMNNPSNIKYGEFAQKYGAQRGSRATDGGDFAHFPDIETGLKAGQDLLRGKNYSNLTVDAAMKRWSNSGYGGEIYPEVKNKRMYELDDAELAELQKRQIKIETPQVYAQIYSH